MAKHSRGFTLIELLVVLVILGILATLTTLAIGTDQAAVAREEAHRLAALLDQAGDEAALQGRELGIQFNQRGYRFLRLEPLAEGAPQWVPLDHDRLLRPRQFRADIAPSLLLEGLPQPLPTGWPEEAAPQVVLSSSGERTPFRLQLAIAGMGNACELRGGLLGAIEVAQAGP